MQEIVLYLIEYCKYVLSSAQCCRWFGKFSDFSVDNENKNRTPRSLSAELKALLDEHDGKKHQKMTEQLEVTQKTLQVGRWVPQKLN